jgi:hypothetical protein
MLSRNGVEAKHLRFFVPSLLRMTGIFILLGTLNKMSQAGIQSRSTVASGMRYSNPARPAAMRSKSVSPMW